MIAHGHLHYGENKVQEAAVKWSEQKKNNQNLKLHMVGKLQSNKAKDAVKIFDYMENDHSWRPSSSYYLFNKFRDSFKIKENTDLNSSYYIILEPYKKKWIPSLKNSKIVTDNIKITKDLFNQTFISREIVDRKKQINFNKVKTVVYLGDEIKNYYTLIPENISNKLKLWVKNNNTSSHSEFINKINKRFVSLI